MYNYLRSNYLSAFVGNYDQTNANGGVALWDVPPKVSCANNPIVFTRTKYLHRTSTTPVTLGLPQPDYISFSGGVLSFQYAVQSGFYVKVQTTAGVFTEYISAGMATYSLYASRGTVIAILGLGWQEEYCDSDYLKDSSYIYIRKGCSYQSDDYMCNGNTGDVMFRNAEIDTYVLSVYKSDGTAQTLSAESFKGRTKFDVSAVVRGWMYDDLAILSSPIVSDKALYARFNIKGIGGVGSAYSYLAVNAVAQIGETSDLSGYIGKPLTGFDRLSMYDGYDLDYAVLAGEDALTLALGTAQKMAVSRVKCTGAYNYLGDESSTPILTDELKRIAIAQKMEIPVLSRCVPDNPFYVRWINRLGGVDYWMFSRQQKRVSAVKSATEYAPYVENTASAKTNRRNYSLATENTITVGTVGLSEDVFEELKFLPFSSLVEWFNEKAGKWIALSVSKFDGQYQTRDALYSFEATFNLPTINTQYRV